MPTILYLCGVQDPPTVGARIGREGKARWLPSGELEVLRSEGEHETAYRFLFHATAANAISELARTAVDLVVLDNRPDPHRPYPTFAATPAGKFLPILSAVRVGWRTVSRRQIVLLLSSGETLARDVYVAGAMKLGGYMVDPFIDAPSPDRSRPGFLDQLATMLGTRRPGKVALCLAGGGIEGLIYELGVLRALDEFLVNRKVHDFDIFCGISSGAVVAAFLANGVPVAELVAGLADGTETIDPVGRSVLFRPNTGEIVSRLARLARGLLRRTLWGEEIARPARQDAGAPRTSPGPLDAVDALMRLVPAGFFSGDGLRWYLEEQLTRGGRTNCFRQLRKELYIGATDQDSGRHVVFGEAGLLDVPISHAVRASCALVPYYPPELILGRYMVDGAYTRTTNFAVAIRHGARLVTIVNPFVPLVGADPGAVDRQGGVFAALQGLKTLVYSRFEQSFMEIDSMYPDVDFQVFMPEGEELEQLSGTLMKFFYRVEIADLAYERTVARLRQQMPGIAERFRQHGLILRDPRSEEPVALSGPTAKAPVVPEIAARAG